MRISRSENITPYRNAVGYLTERTHSARQAWLAFKKELARVLTMGE